MLIALSVHVASASPTGPQTESDLDRAAESDLDPAAESDLDPVTESDLDPVTESDALAATARSAEVFDLPNFAEHSAWGVGSEDLLEPRDRRYQSLIGRIDISVVWRRTTDLSAIREELWLVGTWTL